MSDTITVLEFNIAELDSVKYPKGAIISFKDKTCELSIEAGPGSKSLTVSFTGNHGNKSQDYGKLTLSLKELADLFPFEKTIKESYHLKKKRAS